MELREEVLDRIISIMGEVKKKGYHAIFVKYEIPLKLVIKNFNITKAMNLLSSLYLDTYFDKDIYVHQLVKSEYYEILNIIKINIMKPDAVIKKDIINCVTETAV